MLAPIRTDPPISNFWSGSVLPIPTFPSLGPSVTSTVTYSVLAELTLKYSLTVRMPTWRLSSSGNIALVNVAMPVENKFLKVRSVTSKEPVTSISLKVAIPVTFKLSRSKLSVPSKL